MSNPVLAHYQNHPYPSYPLIASVRRCDTYALNLRALWARFNNTFPPVEAQKILIAGCGTFAPYPMAVANPDVAITALDLSERSLRRARWHCLLHGRRNVVFRCGDLSGQHGIDGHFGLIDSYGVLHHLENPLEGLKTLAGLLAPGGIVRVMLYSRYARRREESIRRALRMLGIQSPDHAGRLLGKARPGSRLADFLAASDETASASGFADALLHPCVHTYRVDELLELIAQAGLKPLLFAHRGALEGPDEEISRLRMLEKERRSPGNFVIYLGSNNSNQAQTGSSDSVISLNPCLVSAVSSFVPGALRVTSRIGVDNPVLAYRDKSFLRKFKTAVPYRALSGDEMKLVAVYKRLLFLIESRA